MKFDVLRDRATLPFIADESARVPAAPAGLRNHAVRAVERIKAWLHVWAERRRERAIQAALARLDDVTLRDLGIRRSESGSIAAELVGNAAPTRRHILLAHGEVLGDARHVASADYYR